jgi:hypothetical protein
MPGAFSRGLGLRLLNFDLDCLKLQLQFLDDLLLGLGTVLAPVFFLNLLLDSLQLLLELRHRGGA